MVFMSNEKKSLKPFESFELAASKSHLIAVAVNSALGCCNKY